MMKYIYIYIYYNDLREATSSRASQSERKANQGAVFCCGKLASGQKPLDKSSLKKLLESFPSPACLLSLVPVPGSCWQPLFEECWDSVRDAETTCI